MTVKYDSNRGKFAVVIPTISDSPLVVWLTLEQVERLQSDITSAIGDRRDITRTAALDRLRNNLQ